jgi:hypothetical protein
VFLFTEVTVAGKRHSVNFDTGAAYFSVGKAGLARLKKDNKIFQEIRKTELILSDGHEVETDLYLVSSLWIGPCFN